MWRASIRWCMGNYFSLKTAFTCPASTSKSQSSSSSMSLRHEQGLTPLPFNQSWNISLQHSCGSLLFLTLIASNFAPNSSNSNWNPKVFHFGATVSMILILFPSLVFIMNKFLRVGVASVQEVHHGKLNPLINVYCSSRMHNSYISVLKFYHIGFKLSPTSYQFQTYL